MRTESTRNRINLCRMGLLLGLVAFAYGSTVTASAAPASALKIGLLMDYSTGNEEAVRNRQRAFELAIKHVNQGGGVLGQPVEFAIGDTTRNPEKAVAEARRLVEVEGVHAIVGPNSSANALPVAERVIGPAGIPTITFSATSPRLTAAADHDFLFRTAVSDIAQGPVLARITRERGVDNVGLLYVDDAWGRGLAGAFKAAWAGKVKAVAFDRQQAGFVGPLRESASEGAQALVVIAFASAAEKIVREAIEHGIYRLFTFGDSAKRERLVRSLGGTRLGGMFGSGGGTGTSVVTASSRAWDAAYIAEHGALPVLAYVREAYDATVALALAAQAAGSLDGAAIRDRLRAVGAAPGTTVTAGPQGVADALRILADGEEIDYEGAAVTMDWDENGDLRRGHVGIWRFTGDERIEEVGAVPYER
ncbi:MAG: ABC transporter substrate-binding protein [Deltaproteobacteria bacterium]|nr:ABC transporter substrate-binding protein [Deltaproteobacteria bacterium]